MIASNIPNADTPGYVAKELNLTNICECRKRGYLPLSQRTSRNVSAANLNVVDRTPATIGLDGKMVDAGWKKCKLAQAGIDFILAAGILGARLGPQSAKPSKLSPLQLTAPTYVFTLVDS